MEPPPPDPELVVRAIRRAAPSPSTGRGVCETSAFMLMVSGHRVWLGAALATAVRLLGERRHEPPDCATDVCELGLGGEYDDPPELEPDEKDEPLVVDAEVEDRVALLPEDELAVTREAVEDECEASRPR